MNAVLRNFRIIYSVEDTQCVISLALGIRGVFVLGSDLHRVLQTTQGNDLHFEMVSGRESESKSQSMV